MGPPHVVYFLVQANGISLILVEVVYCKIWDCNFLYNFFSVVNFSEIVV